jgi:hypothetical protein
MKIKIGSALQQGRPLLLFLTGTGVTLGMPVKLTPASVAIRWMICRLAW